MPLLFASNWKRRSGWCPPLISCVAAGSFAPATCSWWLGSSRPVCASSVCGVSEGWSTSRAIIRGWEGQPTRSAAAHLTAPLPTPSPTGRTSCWMKRSGSIKRKANGARHVRPCKVEVYMYYWAYFNLSDSSEKPYTDCQPANNRRRRRIGKKTKTAKSINSMD